MPSGSTGSGGPDKAAVSFTVKIGGSSAKGFRPKQIIWRSGPQANYCELIICDRFEGFSGIVPNAVVEVKAHVAASSSSGAATIPIFVGRVSGSGAQFDPDSETISVICLGPRWDLGKDYVNGQEHLTYELGEDGDIGTRELAVVTALPCVFNANGKGNKAPSEGDEEVKDFNTLAHPIFHPDPRVTPSAAILWNAAEMLEYIYRQRSREFRRETRLKLSGTEAKNVVGDPLGADFSAPPKLIGDVHYGLNVNTLPLVAGFDAVLAMSGYRWWLKPISAGAGPFAELHCELKSLTAALSGSVGALPGGGAVIAPLPPVKPLYLPKVAKGRLAPAPDDDGTAVDGPDLGASTLVNVSRGTINQDYSKVLSDVVAFGGPIRFQFEVFLNPGWRVLDAAAALAKLEVEIEPAGPVEVDLTDLQRAQAAKRRSTEGSAGSSWEPAASDPGAPYFADVGRLFLIDQTGYELVDFETGEPTGLPVMGDVGSFENPIVPRPRPFLTALLSDRPLHEKGQGFSVSRRRRPAQLEIHHPDLEKEPDEEDEGADDGFRGVPDGAWVFDPDRGAIRIVDSNILRFPYFNADKIDAYDSGPVEDGSPFADRAKITVVVDSDWLRSFAATGDAEVEARAMVLADREYTRAAVDETDPIDGKLADFAGRRRAVNAEPIRAASFSIPFLTFAYEPCDWISKIIGRDVDIVGQVVEVRFDCDAQDTHIQLEDVRIFLGEGDAQ